MAFNIKQLLLCVAAVAVALAALAMANKPYVDSLARLATIGVLVLMAYGIWTTEREHRAFCIGFLAWGCVYYLFHVVLDVDSLNFGTGSLLSPLLTLFHPNVYVPDQFGNTVDQLLYEKFFLIGHCILTLIFALIGGIVTAFFYRKRQRMLKTQT